MLQGGEESVLFSNPMYEQAVVSGAQTVPCSPRKTVHTNPLCFLLDEQLVLGGEGDEESIALNERAPQNEEVQSFQPIENVEQLLKFIESNSTSVQLKLKGQKKQKLQENTKIRTPSWFKQNGEFGRHKQDNQLNKQQNKINVDVCNDVDNRNLKNVTESNNLNSQYLTELREEISGSYMFNLGGKKFLDDREDNQDRKQKKTTQTTNFNFKQQTKLRQNDVQDNNESIVNTDKLSQNCEKLTSPNSKSGNQLNNLQFQNCSQLSNKVDIQSQGSINKLNDFQRQKFEDICNNNDSNNFHRQQENLAQSNDLQFQEMTKQSKSVDTQNQRGVDISVDIVQNQKSPQICKTNMNNKEENSTQVEQKKHGIQVKLNQGGNVQTQNDVIQLDDFQRSIFSEFRENIQDSLIQKNIIQCNAIKYGESSQLPNWGVSIESQEDDLQQNNQDQLIPKQSRAEALQKLKERRLHLSKQESAQSQQLITNCNKGTRIGDLSKRKSSQGDSKPSIIHKKKQKQKINSYKSCKVAREDKSVSKKVWRRGSSTQERDIHIIKRSSSGESTFRSVQSQTCEAVVENGNQENKVCQSTEKNQAKNDTKEFKRHFQNVQEQQKSLVNKTKQIAKEIVDQVQPSAIVTNSSLQPRSPVSKAVARCDTCISPISLQSSFSRSKPMHQSWVTSKNDVKLSYSPLKQKQLITEKNNDSFYEYQQSKRECQINNDLRNQQIDLQQLSQSLDVELIRLKNKFLVLQRLKEKTFK